MKFFIAFLLVLVATSGSTNSETDKFPDPYDYVYSLGFDQKQINTLDNTRFYSFKNKFADASKQPKKTVNFKSQRVADILFATLLLMK